jgi:uncharacterized protein (UPF0147 family)
LWIEHDTAVALLEAQMDLKKKEAIMERSTALNVGRDLSNANNMPITNRASFKQMS